MSSKTFTPRPFFQASILMFVCSNFANIFQFLFQSFMRRELTTGDFSLMNSLFGSMAFLSIPIAIWTQIWVRKFAELRARGQLGLAIHYIKKMTLYSVLYATLTSIVLLFFMDGIKSFLNTDNTFAVFAFVFGLVMALALPMSGVLLQGMQAFGCLAGCALFVPILRLVLGYFFVKMGWGAGGGIWATMIAGTVNIFVAVGFMFAYGLFRLPPESGDAPSHWKKDDLWVPAVSVIAGTVLINTDFVLVQHLFSKEMADRFATAAIFGHSMVFFLMPIATVMLPKVVDHFEGWNTAEKSVVRKALALSFGIAVLTAIAGTLLAGFALKIFAGRAADPETLSLIQWFLWAMIPSSLASLCLNAIVARLQGKLMLVCLVICLMLPALILWQHATLYQILAAHCIVGSLLLSTIVLGNLKRLKPARG